MATSPQTPMPDGGGWPFLTWIRLATEHTWSEYDEPTFAEYEARGVAGGDWRRGTRWTGGLSDAELAGIEERFGVRFSPGHRQFLQVLHATEPRMSGTRFAEGNRMVPVDRPGFYHWLRDESEIRARHEWVIDGIAFDVERNALWRNSWGARPGDEAARRARVEALVAAAPKLLPIYGHRFVLSEGPEVVLSVHQSDIIVYGADLREYLLNELRDLIGIELEWSSTPVDTKGVPFWGELIG